MLDRDFSKNLIPFIFEFTLGHNRISVGAQGIPLPFPVHFSPFQLSNHLVHHLHHHYHHSSQYVLALLCTRHCGKHFTYIFLNSNNKIYKLGAYPQCLIAVPSLILFPSFNKLF